jgi:type IV secretory pathway ATPase VirB11/archaellum biosynthesis ATPase
MGIFGGYLFAIRIRQLQKKPLNSNNPVLEQDMPSQERVN